MTDEPKNPPESSATSPSESDETRRAADTSPRADEGQAPGSPASAAAADAGELPPPPDAEQPRPTPESQAALTGKAPSGSSTSGTTVPASNEEAEKSPAPTPRPKPAAPPANETPEEKKARLERIIAEAKAKKEAAAAAAAQAESGGAGRGSEAPPPPGGKSPEVGDPLKSPSQADLERAAKIAEAKARAAAAKEAAAAKSPAAAPGAEKPAPAAKPAAPVPTAAAGAGVPKPPVKKKDEGPKPVESNDHPLVKRLREHFGDAVEGAYTFVNQLSIHVKAESIVEVCKALRDDAETPFDYLSDLTCVHWPEREETPFEVVYNLYSISKNVRVRVKAAAGEAGLDSVTGVWPTANWMEREAYDLFGVNFNNHPDLRRLLLPKDWDGHPLRKDYPLEFMENQWTTRHLPEFTEVQREQLAQRRAYGLEILQTPDERRLREIFRDGRDPLPKEHK
ncbi:MAG: NADH-quinone oxidoreductase subunit C [Acidobacteria bacterium]|nr:NADH-quinone oxidoreductase subunit C [Acidobacteriota bacterium]